MLSLYFWSAFTCKRALICIKMDTFTICFYKNPRDDSSTEQSHSEEDEENGASMSLGCVSRNFVVQVRPVYYLLRCQQPFASMRFLRIRGSVSTEPSML